MLFVQGWLGELPASVGGTVRKAGEKAEDTDSAPRLLISSFSFTHRLEFSWKPFLLTSHNLKNYRQVLFSPWFFGRYFIKRPTSLFFFFFWVYTLWLFLLFISSTTQRRQPCVSLERSHLALWHLSFVIPILFSSKPFLPKSVHTSHPLSVCHLPER